MAAAMKLPKIINVLPTNKHTATVFFFHGSGSNGQDIKEWIDILNRKEFNFPHIKIVYPTAPSQPYTPLGGMLSNVWFDRRDVTIDVPECLESIDTMCNITSELIDNEVANGIPLKRIIVGGFSMGGALAMYLAYRHKTSLAGCIAMSSFLNDNSSVYENLKKIGGNNAPPLLQFHGEIDSLVPISSGEMTHKLLKNLGVKTEFRTLPGVEHELVKLEIHKIREWILHHLPETST